MSWEIRLKNLEEIHNYDEWKVDIFNGGTLMNFQRAKQIKFIKWWLNKGDINSILEISCY